MEWKMLNKIFQAEIHMNAKSVMLFSTNFQKFCQQSNTANNKTSKWSSNLKKMNRTGNVSFVHIQIFLTLKRKKSLKKMMLFTCYKVLYKIKSHKTTQLLSSALILLVAWIQPHKFKEKWIWSLEFLKNKLKC